MPTYEYKCVDEVCEHVTSRTSKISERDEPCPCEVCGKETIKGFYSNNTPFMQLKGTGWTPKALSPMGRRRKKST